MTSSAPPEDMIDLAVRTARLSPCAKSKRGVVVFGHDKDCDNGVDAIANGFNGQPLPFECDGTDHCKEACAKRCVHAEDRALRQACIVHVANNRGHRRHASDWLEGLGNLREYEAVHVKLDAAGNLTWGGGPSCWQCSRTVMDVHLGAFWLYEREFPEWECRHSDRGKLEDACQYCAGMTCARHLMLITDIVEACGCSVADRHIGLPAVSTVWRRYTAEEFHRATLKANGL